MLRKWVSKLAGFSARYPWAMLAASLVITAFAIWGLSGLPFYTSRKALFRADQETVQRLDQFLENFGAASDLMIALEGIPRPELEKFALELADALSGQPGVRNADPRIDLKFFMDHAYNMVPAEDLATAKKYIPELLQLPENPPDSVDDALDTAIEWFEDPPSLSLGGQDIASAKAAIDGIYFFLHEWQRWLEAPEPPTSIAWEVLLHQQPDTQALVAGNGFYSTRDGRMLFLFVSPESTSEAYEVIAPFIETVRSVTEQLREKWVADGKEAPIYGLTGNPAIVYEEFTSVQDDIKFTIITAAVLVLLLIIFVMRSLRRALVVFIPIGLGAVWGNAMLLFTVGHLNMITSAFTAILFGLGADYGIFVSSRILEELKNGLGLKDAIAKGAGAASTPVLTAGGASIMVFLALATVKFKGFSELGIVAACGVLAVVLAAFVALPALFAILKPKVQKDLLSDGVDKQGQSGTPMPKVASAIMVTVALLIAGFGAYSGINLPVNYDVLALLPKESEAAHYSRLMTAESDFQSEVVIATANSTQEAAQLVEKFSKLDTIAKVQHICDLFPADAELRAAEAREVGLEMSKSTLVAWLLDQKRIELPKDGGQRISGILDKALDMIDDYQETAFSAGHTDLVDSLEKVRTSAQKIAQLLRADPDRVGVANQLFLDNLLEDAQILSKTIISWRDARPLAPADLSASLKNRFVGKDGKIAIYLFPTKSIYNVEFLDKMLGQIYEISPDATGFPTTHQVMSREAFESFMKGSGLAVAVALLFLLITLGSFGSFLIAALPLLIGGGWMLGVLAAAKIPLNYGNMIALPLLMALALDYGVWVAHRRKELVGLGPWQVIRVAGTPILLAALTTLAGLGAISFAKYRAISSLGFAVTVGLICCLACAMFIPPAVAQLLDRRRK